MGTQRELSNEYQNDRVKMVFKIFCIIMLWMNVALSIERVSMDIDHNQEQLVLNIQGNAIPIY